MPPGARVRRQNSLSDECFPSKKNAHICADVLLKQCTRRSAQVAFSDSVTTVETVLIHGVNDDKGGKRMTACVLPCRASKIDYVRRVAGAVLYWKPLV